MSATHAVNFLEVDKQKYGILRIMYPAFKKL
jgi:hypothetical protein